MFQLEFNTIYRVEWNRLNHIIRMIILFHAISNSSEKSKNIFVSNRNENVPFFIWRNRHRLTLLLASSSSNVYTVRVTSNAALPSCNIIFYYMFTHLRGILRCCPMVGTFCHDFEFTLFQCFHKNIKMKTLTQKETFFF